MNWSDERYVRVYSRDTVDWISLGWESQALFVLLLRKVDRAGLLPLGRHGIRGLAGLVGMPVDVVTRAIEPILADGCVEIRESVLVVRNFIEAQETTQSDKQRQAECRARSRDLARAKELFGSIPSVTNRDTSVTKRDENVTDCHAASQDVTPYRAVPSVPSVPLKIAGQESAPPGFELIPPVAKRKGKKQKTDEPPDPRHTPTRLRLEAVWLALKGTEYRWSAADGTALKALLKFAGPDEIVSRAERGLQSRFPTANSVSEIRKHWNAFGHNTRATDFSGKAPIRAEDIPRAAFATTGQVNNF